MDKYLTDNASAKEDLQKDHNKSVDSRTTDSRECIISILFAIISYCFMNHGYE